MPAARSRVALLAALLVTGVPALASGTGEAPDGMPHRHHGGDGHAMTAVGPLHVMSPWSRAVPPVSKTGAVYLVVGNHGTGDDALLGATSPVAERITLHESEITDGVMRMRPARLFEIPAGGHAALEPGGAHLMLVGLRQPLVAGAEIPLTLRFRDAGEVEVRVRVLEPGAEGPADPHAQGAGHTDADHAGHHGHTGGEHLHPAPSGEGTGNP